MTKTLKNLETLIDRYVENKKTMEDYKKLVDTDNTEIKNIMKKQNLDKVETDNNKVTLVTQTRTTMDEKKMMMILKANNIKGVIKTKEYIDMDVLEGQLYNGKIPANVIKQLQGCKDEKEVLSLRVAEKK